MAPKPLTGLKGLLQKGKVVSPETDASTVTKPGTLRFYFFLFVT